jgi:2-dehydropantoate 2-reductase
MVIGYAGPRMTRIAIYGAGSIGCYVGGRLAATGSDVVFVGRERLGRELQTHGLHLTDWEGAALAVVPDAVRYATTPAAVADAELVLVTVKSAATDDAGRELAPVLPASAVVVSFQNGLHNGGRLREHLPEHVVLTGMVQFNVVNHGTGRFHHGSEGRLEVERHPRLDAYLSAFARAGLPLVVHERMLPVQWAKLVLNLNNPINALSNLPLKTQLSERAYRRCVALVQTEALALLAAAGITPAKLTLLPPAWIPWVLRLPDAVFTRLAGKMLAIDPQARSSMWEDLEAGRRTEVDYLNGEIVRLAERLGRTAPVNARLVALVRAAESGGQRTWSGPDLLADLTAGCRKRAICVVARSLTCGRSPLPLRVRSLAPSATLFEQPAGCPARGGAVASLPPRPIHSLIFESVSEWKGERSDAPPRARGSPQQVAQKG